eukprot:TRINITY_DN1056_c0_g1_i1.p1 TRINITY_DN1056_c0_g1~~TRINITY_DN1056_c0_g1_i1.p1  ORF type:complete len:434 (-),score=79.95 TRINITY_DN1056_c0_g1_i1:196-1497(-)
MGTRKLRVSVIGFGSRGDVQPVVALALGLKNRGHIVQVVTTGKHKEFVERFSLECVTVMPDLEMSKEVDSIKQGSNAVVMRLLESIYTPESFDQLHKILEKCDIAVSQMSAIDLLIPISKSLKIPLVSVPLQPVFSTSEFPQFLFPYSLPFKFLNTWSYSLITRLFWWFVLSRANPILAQKGLPLTSHAAFAEFHQTAHSISAFDPLMLPGEKVPSDWPAPARVPGFLFMPLGSLGNLDVETENWINEDPNNKPIYIGFGSMPASNPTEMLRTILKIVYSLRTRAIYNLGWNELTKEMRDEILAQDNERRVWILSESPHDVLFPKCSVIIHHGGSGTTGAALRSGVPQIIFPHVADQPFNADRVFSLGLSPLPIPVAELTSESLETRISCVLSSDEMRTNAQKVASLLRKDGVEKSVEIIEQEYERYHGRIQS